VEPGDGDFGHHEKISLPTITQQLYKLPLNAVWIEISLRGFNGYSPKAPLLAGRASNVRTLGGESILHRRMIFPAAFAKSGFAAGRHINPLHKYPRPGSDLKFPGPKPISHFPSGIDYPVGRTPRNIPAQRPSRDRRRENLHEDVTVHRRKHFRKRAVCNQHFSSSAGEACRQLIRYFPCGPRPG